MQQEHIYVGIWRYDGWSLCPIEDLTEGQLVGLNVLQDVRTTVLTDLGLHTDLRLQQALHQLAKEALEGVDPLHALYLTGHTCRGLELLREHVRRANSRPNNPS